MCAIRRSATIRAQNLSRSPHQNSQSRLNNRPQTRATLCGSEFCLIYTGSTNSPFRLLNRHSRFLHTNSQFSTNSVLVISILSSLIKRRKFLSLPRNSCRKIKTKSQRNYTQLRLFTRGKLPKRKHTSRAFSALLNRLKAALPMHMRVLGRKIKQSVFYSLLRNGKNWKEKLSTPRNNFGRVAVVQFHEPY